MVGAMRDAVPDDEFAIVSIETGDYRGTYCDGSRMWETAEELTARLAIEGNN